MRYLLSVSYEFFHINLSPRKIWVEKGKGLELLQKLLITYISLLLLLNTKNWKEWLKPLKRILEQQNYLIRINLFLKFKEWA